MKTKILSLDKKLTSFFRRTYLPVARLSLFVVFFWFGLLKLLGESPATPIARELINKTIGSTYFNELYILLALLECLIGILFLFPKAARIVIPLLMVHLITVSSPLLLVSDLTWRSILVPTLEGQYIIKNLAIIAVAFGIAAHTKPISTKSD
jgi:uncharacterized membrane protein YphA (DoxX/SURF4 family)